MSSQYVIDAAKADREQADADAAQARDLADAATDPVLRRQASVPAEDLLAAAQVYATLATRRY
jgi:hypothetical protein